MKLSIGQAQTLKVSANLGQVRLQKALAALADKRILFHGFVSNTVADPLAGSTVRLAGATEGERTAETALTDGDGYFSIVLGEQRGADPTHGMAQRLATMMRAETGAAAGQDGKAQVEIVGANNEVRQVHDQLDLLRHEITSLNSINSALESQLQSARTDLQAGQARLDACRVDFAAELEKIRQSAKQSEDRLAGAEARALVEIDRERMSA